jgi:hypothetical protein
MKKTLDFPDGSKYVGFMKDDNQHGQGVLIFPDGKKYEGEWIDGEFVG